MQIDSPIALIGNDNNNRKEMNEIWHVRMRHLHHRVLMMLRETVTGVLALNTENDDLYQGCVLGKYAKAVLPRSDSRANVVLGLIHSYICGPMSTRVLSSGKYFITIIDDHSKKT